MPPQDIPAELLAPAVREDSVSVRLAQGWHLGYRAVATRYDKREFVYRETIDVATIGIWLR